jgi:phosphoribosylglycinamide formyltransferase-1
MHQLILFASGRGSNVQAIIDFFQTTPIAQVALIVCNNAQAGVLNIAREHNIPVSIIDKSTFKQEEFVNLLSGYNPSLLVLAGFLWKVPTSVVEAFAGRIINIHPALLPAYGGKGMYGAHVHEAVITAKEQESGITIHYVNERYDEGNILLQARCKIETADTPETLAHKIHQLEHFYFPRTIQFLLENIQR